MNWRTIIEDPMITKSLGVLALRVIGVGLFFGLTLYITNYFNDDLVGTYDLSRALLFIAGSICLLGMNESIIYYSGVLSANDSMGSIKQLYRKMLLLITGTCAIAVLVILLVPNAWIDWLFDKPVHQVVVKTFLGLWFYAITMLNIEVFRAIKRITLSELYRNIGRFLFFFIGVIYISRMGEYQSLIDVFLLNFVLLALISSAHLWVLFQKLPKTNGFDVGRIKEILKRSYPMSISLICFLIMQSTDVLVLGRYMDLSDVAYYSVAVKLTMIVALVLSSVNAVFAPKISELFSLGDKAQLKTQIRSATRLIFVLTAPVILIMIFGATHILDLFGPNYHQAGTALKILLAAQTINAMSGSVGVYMNMTGQERTFQRILMVAVMANVLLNLLLIPKYGLIGAAAATGISMAGWNLFSVWLLYRNQGIKTFIH